MVHGGEECGDITSDGFGFLGGGEVAARGHHGPAVDVIQPFGPFPGRLAFGDKHVRKDRDGGRHLSDVIRAEARLALPAAIVVVVAHRGGDGGRHPVQGDDRKQEIRGEPGLQVAVTVAPGPPFLQDPGGQPRRGVGERVAKGLRLGGLDRGVAALGPVPPLSLLQVTWSRLSGGTGPSAATPRSSPPSRRPLATRSPTPRRGWPPGSWRNGGPGAIVTATCNPGSPRISYSRSSPCTG